MHSAMGGPVANSTCLLSNDNAFGPAIRGCRDDFDFTLLFEQSILSIVPSVLLLTISPFRILRLVRRNVKTFPTPIRIVKAITTIAFLGVQIALVALWSSHAATNASIPSATLGMLDAVAILVLSTLEHGRSVRPSSILNLYLILSVLFDSTQVRTLYLRSENHAILALSFVSIAVKIALFILENHNKRSYLLLPYKTWSLEATSGTVSRIFFWWLNPLFYSGFRRNFSSTDLYFLDPELLSESLEKRMEDAWRKYSSSGRYALVYASAWCLRWQLLMTVFPRLLLIGFNYAQPFLIATAISYVATPGGTKNYGYGLIGATFLIYLGIAMTSTYSQHRTFRMITVFRGCMVSLIYTKTLKLEDGVYDEAKALTLMSSDIDRITARIESVLEIWANIISIAIGIWLLERQLGWVCVAPIIVTIICTYGSIKVASFMGPAQGVWLGAIQKRVTMTSSMLASMKSIKMMGLTEKLETMVQGQRIRELDLSAKFRWLSICRLVVATTPGLLGPLLTFAIFAIQTSVQHSTSLSTAQAFTSLAIISLLTTPAQALLSCLPTITAALASFDRIQEFLLAPSWKDEGTERNVSFDMPADTADEVELQTFRFAADCGPAVVVNNASIKPSKVSPFAINGISFQVERGSLTMIIGPIGSGKSTLLKAILGERPCETGTIKVASTQMAYCRQTAWLPNTTVREIVCGVSVSSEIDSEFYDTVIHACSLEEDISQLPNGHDTLIGSRGVTLSGGQKQRLALARAVYARADLVILDDVLGALDLETKAKIISQLFSKSGLFRKHGTTVILATHETHHLELADKILVLDSAGHLLEERAANNLSPLREFSQTFLDDNTKAGTSSNVAPVQKPLPKSLAGPTAKDVDDLTRRTGDISLYKYYFASIGWKLSLLLLSTLVLNTLSAYFPQIWLKWYTEKTIKGVALFASMYTVFVLTSLTMTTASMIIMFLRATTQSGARLHKVLLSAVMHAPQSFFDKTDTGVTLNRFSQDMMLVDSDLPTSVIITLQALVNCLAQTALISIGSSYMGFTAIGLVVALYFIQNVYLKTSRQIRFLDLEAKSPLYTHFFETLDGLSTIRAFGWESRFTKTSNRCLDDSQRPYYMMYCIQRWLSIVLQLLIGAMAVIVVGLAVGLKDTTSAGNLGIALTTILTFNTNVQFLLTWWTTLETSLGAISRTKNFTEQTPKEKKPEENFVPGSDWPNEGRIEFQGISASYGNSDPALQDVVMNIAAGEKIGICGRTGSGKSTLLSVLLRLLDMNNGTIMIDGVDLKTVPREIIRTRLVAVPQDPFLLSGSIRLNADPTEMVPDDLIIAAMKKVKLWDVLESRGGLDADMTRQALSQGQQQLFCLGSALLRTGSKILILDEATSSMDLETDQLVQELLRKEFKHHTIITVAHRLATIEDADRVAVLDQGTIVEFGDPKELLKKNSAFKKLYGQG